MKMNNMRGTKRTTQSWRYAALNHTSPFSPFFQLALALLRSPNSHKPTEAGSSATGKLQSCARCVIFHSRRQEVDLRNPGQTGKSQSSFKWCWNSYIACVYGGHARENPHQETGLTYRGAVHSKGGTISTIKVRAPCPPHLEDICRLHCSQEQQLSCPCPGTG